MKLKIVTLFTFLVCYNFVTFCQVKVSFPAINKEPLNNTPKDALVLYKGWQMRESAIIGTDGASISKTGFKLSNWYNTTVPTTIQAVLIRNGVYPDPYIGSNNWLIPDASDDFNARFHLGKFSHLADKSNPWSKPYWFRKEFQLPANYKGKTVWLNFDGINYRAEVWVNGKLVADSSKVVGMFKRFHFNLSKFVNVGAKNTLAVLIYPLDHPGDPVIAPLDGFAGRLGACAGDGEILRDVTQYTSAGWDWVAPSRDRNIGFWQHVWLQATGPVIVSDPATFTSIDQPEAKQADIKIRCMVENTSSIIREIELKLHISPVEFDGPPIDIKTKISIAPQKIQEVILTSAQFPELKMKNPRLWWPVTYGKQPLYHLTIKTYVNSVLSNTAENNFGVRTVESKILPSGGRVFLVNGKPIRLIGGAWIPDMLMSWSAQRYKDEVRLMAEGNHTIVRVFGGGIIAPDVFMNACDKYGVLVWQELSRSSVQSEFRKDKVSSWTPLKCDPKVYLDNMKDCIIRLRSHPSLLIWGGSNEAAAQEDIGIALENHLLPELDGTRIWLPSSSEKPEWSKVEMGVWTGGPWDLKRLYEYFPYYQNNPTTAFKDEMGLASPPTINSFAKSIPTYNQPKPEWFPFNIDFSYHDAAGFAGRALDDIMRHDLGQPTSVAEYLWMADLYNNQAYRAVFEAANKARPRNYGTLLWKTNAAWPSYNWQLFDWYLRPNAGYYSMRSACKPLHLQASVDDMTLQVASNLLISQLNMKIRTTVVSCNGKTESIDTRSVSVKADGLTLAGSLPEIVKDNNLHFVALDLFNAKDSLLDRTVYWLQKNCKWQQLLMLQDTKPTIKVVNRSVKDGEITYTIQLQNTSTLPAVNLMLEVLKGIQGEEVLPSFWSDNAITLMPGEKRIVTVSFRNSLLENNTPHLMVEGWNILPYEINVSDNLQVSLNSAVTSVQASAKGEKITVKFDAILTGSNGQRVTTTRFPVTFDGKIMRYVLIGLKAGQKSSGLLLIPGCAKGEHKITVADKFSKVMVN